MTRCFRITSIASTSRLAFALVSFATLSAGCGDGDSASVNCEALCAKHAAVVAELACTDAMTESACLSECKASELPAATPCLNELVARYDCEATAPTADFGCPLDPGKQPRLKTSEGTTCYDDAFAYFDCIDASRP